MLEEAVLVAVRKWVEEEDSPNDTISDSQSFTYEGSATKSGHKKRDANKYGLCGANKRSGGVCSNYLGYGTSHPGIGRCKFHGGSTPNHIISAQRQMIEAAMVTYGIEIETTAEDALTREINRTAGHVAWLQAKVNELSDRELIWGIAESKQLMRTDYLDDADSDGPMYEAVMRAGGHVWLKLYQQERDHLVKVCAIAIKSGLDERKVRLAERQGMQMSYVIREFAIEMGIPPERMPDVPDALRRALERIMGGPRVLDGALAERTVDEQGTPVHSVLDH